jgi:hypothetical protein
MVSLCYSIQSHRLHSSPANDFDLCITGILIIWNVTVPSVLVEINKAKGSEISHAVLRYSRVVITFYDLLSWTSAHDAT